MTIVRIVKNWSWPDIFRQMPRGAKSWGDVSFTEDEMESADYLLVLNRVATPLRAFVPPQNVWLLIQEPAIPTMDFVWEGHRRFGKVLTHMPLGGSRYIASQPATPWHVGRSYDQLVAMTPPAKPMWMSLIASNLAHFPGHRRRWQLVEAIREAADLDIDVYGKGVRFVEDKWDALASYRYSIAVENSSSTDYWTEKIADCFLSWTVPVYFGCTNILDYFPPRSIIALPADRPAEALELLRRLKHEDDYESRLDALAEARRLVLDRYQLFPHIASLVAQDEATRLRPPRARRVHLPIREETLLYRIRHRLRRDSLRIRTAWLGAGSTAGE